MFHEILKYNSNEISQSNHIKTTILKNHRSIKIIQIFLFPIFNWNAKIIYLFKANNSENMAR